MILRSIDGAPMWFVCGKCGARYDQLKGLISHRRRPGGGCFLLLTSPVVA